jgi:fatty-acyl-CoA synthase
MLSTMQDAPLQIRRILEHGAGFHATSHVTTAIPGGFRHARYDTVGANAARLAYALRDLGIGPGDRVATFMWNNQQHVEAYFAVPCTGAVLHPLNIRLAADQVAYIANHAEDRVVIVDASLLPVLASILPDLKTVEHLIVNGSIVDSSTLDGVPVPVHDYGQLLAGRPDRFPWPDLDERSAAAMCYTSGTTGEPKGVVYSHRSVFLHAIAAALPDLFHLSAADRVLAVVPQFHVLAWGLPYSAFLTGAGLAMPDRFLAAAPLAEFIATVRPNKAAGVPTVWQALLNHVESHPDVDISALKEIVVGGSACPPALMDAYERHGVTLLHAWGMTETSPLGSVSRPPVGTTPDRARRYRLTQGRFPAPVEPRLVGPDGSVLPNDGTSVGELEVRGPWITGQYYGAGADPEKFHDGWLRTGDIGSISPDGYLTLTDRAKDVIKSGGEWISSVELENHLMAHPDVLEAAVIGVPDDHWGERPLATVVVRNGIELSALRIFLADRVPKWQLPERWALITEVPKTSVGKFDKKVLRFRYAAGELPVQVLS